MKVRLLPIPDHPILCTEADCAAYDFAPGEDMREPGDRLAGSYANFYIANSAVLVPQFGGENAASDAHALAILREASPPGVSLVSTRAQSCWAGATSTALRSKSRPRTATAECPPYKFLFVKEPVLYSPIYFPRLRGKAACFGENHVVLCRKRSACGTQHPSRRLSVHHIYH